MYTCTHTGTWSALNLSSDHFFLPDKKVFFCAEWVNVTKWNHFEYFNVCFRTQKNYFLLFYFIFWEKKIFGRTFLGINTLSLKISWSSGLRTRKINFNKTAKQKTIFLFYCYINVKFYSRFLRNVCSCRKHTRMHPSHWPYFSLVIFISVLFDFLLIRFYINWRKENIRSLLQDTIKLFFSLLLGL